MKDGRLFEIALTVFRAGVNAGAMASIAVESGLTESELVERFGSVEELFVAALTSATRRLGADLVELAGTDDGAPERLLLMTRRLASPTVVEGVALFAYLREMLEGGELAEKAFEHAFLHGLEAFLRIIGEAQFRGTLAPLPPHFILSVIMSGVVLPQLIGQGKDEGALQGVHARDADANAQPRSALLAASIEAVFNGLLKEPIDLDPRAPVH